MGVSISHLKGSSSPQNGKVSTFACSTTSSQRTMVNSTPGDPKKTSIFGSNFKNKPSILPKNNFFGNMSRKNRTRKENVRLDPVTANSLSRRNPKKDNRKKIAAAITKSMIGRPTNFKHVNSSTTQFNQIQYLHNDDDDTSRVAAQMAILSSMLKPLPNNKDSEIPVIPARTSSYGNDIYIKEFPIPETTIIATPSMKKNRKKATGMKSNSGYTPGSITKRKYTQYHMRSAKKIR